MSSSMPSRNLQEAKKHWISMIKSFIKMFASSERVTHSSFTASLSPARFTVSHLRRLQRHRFEGSAKCGSYGLRWWPDGGGTPCGLPGIRLFFSCWKTQKNILLKKKKKTKWWKPSNWKVLELLFPKGGWIKEVLGITHFWMASCWPWCLFSLRQSS